MPQDFEQSGTTDLAERQGATDEIGGVRFVVAENGQFADEQFKEARETFGERSREIQEDLSKLSEKKDAPLSEYLGVLAKANGMFNNVAEPDLGQPEADPDYRYIYWSAFEPALRAAERFAQSQPERSQAVAGLAGFIENNLSELDPGDLERAGDIIKVMVGVGGVQALPKVSETFDNLTKDFPSKIKFDDKDAMAEAISPWASSLTSLRDSKSRSLHEWVTSAVSEREWSDGERPQAIEFLGKFISHRSEGCLTGYVEAFERLGTAEAVPHLLENLRSDDLLTRRMSAEILFRLELGRVGMSENGVEYLGKLYDLEKLNNPDFFVQRLTARGDMGVFSGGGNLTYTFNLGDVASPQNVVTPEVTKLVSEMVFLPKADETSSERAERERHFSQFVEKYQAFLGNDFFSSTGVRLNNLDLHEQGWFITYYLQADEAQKDKLKEFVGNRGELGLKAFLALDYGGAAEDLLAFSETTGITEKQKGEVLLEFYRIANLAYEWRGTFVKVDETVGSGIAAQVHEALIRKNADFLKAAMVIGRGEGNGVTFDELLHHMSVIRQAISDLKELSTDKPQYQLERRSVDAKEGSVSFELVGKGERVTAKGGKIISDTRDRIIVTTRAQASEGSEARINFRVIEGKTGEEARLGIDVAKVGGEVVGVSMDLGVGKIERVVTEDGGTRRVFPSARVGRVLSLVSGEGAHNQGSFSGPIVGHFPRLAKGFEEYLDKRYNK